MYFVHDESRVMSQTYLYYIKSFNYVLLSYYG